MQSPGYEVHRQGSEPQGVPANTGLGKTVLKWQCVPATGGCCRRVLGNMLGDLNGV